MMEEDKPGGFFMTVKDIHSLVTKIDEKLDERLSDHAAQIAELRAKLAAYGVVIGIITVALGALVADVMIGK